MTNIVMAFTEEQVERLTGISVRQLRYWDRTAFFEPGLAEEDRSKAYSRLYSFRDVVCLRVLNALRNEAHVSLQHLREVRERLSHLGDEMWSKTTLFVLNKRVAFVNPETEAREEVVSGQGVLQIPLAIVTDDTMAAVHEMRRREPSDVGKFERNRNRVSNQLVVAGTRIPVRSIKAFAEAGYSVEQIRGEYPTLTEEDIRAAIGIDDAA